MKAGTKYIAVWIIAVLLLGVCGCMSRKNHPDKEDLVQYLESRYEDSFAYYGPGGGSAGGTSRQIYCTSERCPKHLIWVKYDLETETFTENYLCVKYEEQAEAYLAQILSEVFPEGSYAWLKGTMCNGVSPEGASEDTSFEEYIASPRPALSMCVFVQEQNCGMSPAEAEERLREAVNESGMYLVSGDLFFTDSEEYSGPISDTQFSDIVSTGNYRERVSMKFHKEASGR